MRGTRRRDRRRRRVSLIDRAEDRAERFEGYQESRADEAERASAAGAPHRGRHPVRSAHPCRPPLRAPRTQGRRAHHERHAQSREGLRYGRVLEAPRCRCDPSRQVQGARRRARPSHQDHRGRHAQAGAGHCRGANLPQGLAARRAHDGAGFARCELLAHVAVLHAGRVSA